MKISVGSSGLALHFEKHKGGNHEINGLARHDERQPGGNHSNENIDDSRTSKNVILKTDDKPLNKRIEETIKDHRDGGLKGVRKDAVRYVETTVQLSGQILERSESEQEQVLRDSYDWLSEKFGKDNVVMAAIHKDETNMHLHFGFVPITQDTNKDNEVKNVLKAKKVISQTNLKAYQREFLQFMQEEHPGLNFRRGGGLNGLSQAQYEEFTQRQKDHDEAKDKELADDYKTVDKRDDELDEREDSLDARENAVKDREDAVETKEAEQTAENERLKAEKARLEMENTRLGNKESKLAQLESELNDQSQRVDSREYELERRERAYKERLQAFNEQQKTLDAREMDFEPKRRMVEQRTKDLNRKENDQNERSSQLDDKEQAINDESAKTAKIAQNSAYILRRAQQLQEQAEKQAGENLQAVLDAVKQADTEAERQRIAEQARRQNEDIEKQGKSLFEGVDLDADLGDYQDRKNKGPQQ